MIVISHRGNLSGPNSCKENHLDSILKAIDLGFDVEIDVWCDDAGEIFLGHDSPEYKVGFGWIYKRKENLWVHCKNLKALELLGDIESGINYFWHQNDTATLTSKKIIWAYPGNQPIKNSIAVLPELHNYTNIEKCLGVCTDYPIKYLDEKGTSNFR